MLFYTGSSEQLTLYIETLDVLQDLLDTYSAGSPVILKRQSLISEYFLYNPNQLQKNHLRL